MTRTGPSINRGGSKQDYGTPWGFMRAVEERFGPIVFDLAAHVGNHKHPRYFTEKDNSLVQDWHKIKGNLWLNPPYSDIGPWAEKCWIECQKGARILFLVPASVGSNWFRDFVFGKASVYALNGRLKFSGPDDPGYPKDCILAVFGKYETEWAGSFDIWTWPYQDQQWTQPLQEVI